MKLKEVIEQSDNIVFFGGAGVSTESGIPDFRSESGIYSTVKEYGTNPETIISNSYFWNHPDIFFDFYKKKMIFPEAKPNDAHKALAQLEKMGKLKTVITQNIDGLHQLAGSKNVYELHGSIHRNHCQSCGADYDLEYVIQTDGVPKCQQCGGVVKPEVVLYEEPLNEATITQSIEAIQSAEVLIIGGTSLSVYPAAGFIQYFHGKTLVLINKGETAYDNKVDLLIRDSIGKVMKEAVDENKLGDGRFDSHKR